MRIIKKGTTEKEHTCYRCGTVFAFTAEDAWSHRDIDGVCQYVSCPVCGQSICIDNMKLPFSIDGHSTKEFDK